MKKVRILRLLPLVLAASMALPLPGFAQKNKKKTEKEDDGKYQFTAIHDLKASPVKSQDGVGSCWDYATTSFIESELLRMGKPELDLSEMFTIRYDYVNKADWYVRMHGKNNFAQGGQAHDVMNVVRAHGFVPEKVYPGIMYGEERHNHSELTPMLTSIVDIAREKKLGKVSPVWQDAFVAVLETYLGEAPLEFEYEGKTYSPIGFRDAMGFNPDDYVELTSYTHRPYYKQFPLEVPDNWSHDLYYNLPLDELVQVAYHAFENGYTVCWDGDVSERGNFNHGEGYAVIPAAEQEEGVLLRDRKEEEVCEMKRQEAFDNYQSTDDHLMHLTGVFTDQKGTKYFKTKTPGAKRATILAATFSCQRPISGTRPWPSWCTKAQYREV